MPEYYVPHSARITPGSELWSHHVNKNGRVVLSQQTNPDDNHVSNTRMGTSSAYISGDQLEVVNGDFVIAHKSKGYNAPGTVVGRCTGPTVVKQAAPNVSGFDQWGNPMENIEQPTADKGDIFGPIDRDLRYDPRDQSWYRQKDDEEG